MEAVSALRSAPYALVMMDVRMPEMDGIEATRRIRQLSGHLAKVPIIAVTARALKGDRELILRAVPIETGPIEAGNRSPMRQMRRLFLYLRTVQLTHCNIMLISRRFRGASRWPRRSSGAAT